MASNSIEESVKVSTSSVPLAIEASHLTFTYDRNYFNLANLMEDPLMRQRNEPVLKKISISVPRGELYALLGASGSGKTTLLKCILGRLKPTSGCIRLFGQATLPCPTVGFMPQELALFPALTIQESLTFFGQLYGMTAQKMKSRLKTITALLELPLSGQLIGNLSGGQQRRVSLACALFHQPSLLILDEPTVGVDPLLRAAIWNHLETLSQSEGVTVLLTTHYTEEARTVGTLAFLRDGRLLVEETPANLLQKYNCPHLDDAFLVLCKAQTTEKTLTQPETKLKVTQTLTPIEDTPFKGGQANGFSLSRFRVLLQKNRSLHLRENVPSKLFICFFPALQILLTVLCAGRAPENLALAIVNDDTWPSHLSALFLSSLSSPTITQISGSNLSEVTQMTAEGKLYGVIHFTSNFSSAWEGRIIELADADNATIDSSHVHLYLDMTNPFLGFTLLHSIFLSFERFLGQYLGSLDLNPSTLSPPISIELTAGSLDLTSLFQAVIPALAIYMTFFTAALGTGLSVLLEKKDGLFHRSQIAGVKAIEALLAILCLQTLQLLVQQIVLFTAIFLVLGVSSQGGALVLQFILCFLQGLAGIAYGGLIASLCSSEITGGLILGGTVMPTVILSGFLWPVQALPPVLFWASQALPQTAAIESFTWILYHEVSLMQPTILAGFASTIIWTIIYLFLAVFFTTMDD